MSDAQKLHTTHYIHLWLCVAIAFAMPIESKVLPGGLVLLGCNWIVMLVREGVKDFRFKWFNFGMIGFYLFHAIALLWSQNLDAGLFDLEVKMSFIAIPLIFATAHRFRQKDLKLILGAFVAGTAIILCILYYQAHYNYTHVRWKPFWYYGKYFITHMHLGYFAMYVNVALCVCAWFLIYGWNKMHWILRIMLFLLIIMFSIAEIRTTSKNGIFTLILLYVMITAYVLIKKRKWLLGLVSLALISTVFIFTLNNSARTTLRFTSAYEAMVGGEHDKTSTESTAIRTFAWESALAVISENKFIGVGTGDAKEELKQKYKDYGYTGAYEIGVNAHSQFLQTAVALGFVGFALLIMIFGFATRIAILNRKRLLGLFLFVVAFYGLTEAIFEVQAGIIFFVFFACVLVNTEEKDDESKPRLS
jgi:O-antigen ligase